MTKRDARADAGWSLEGLLGAGGARALLAGLGAAGVVLSIPADTLGRWIDSAGLSEMVPVLAQPLSFAVRSGLAIVVGLLASVLVFFAWRLLAHETTMDKMAAPADGLKGTIQMDESRDTVRPAGDRSKLRRPAKKPGLASRLATMLGLRRKRSQSVNDSLVRRRADRHPDAPARQPLRASRDLPPPENGIEERLGIFETSSPPTSASTPLPGAAHERVDETRFSGGASGWQEEERPAQPVSRWALPEEEKAANEFDDEVADKQTLSFTAPAAADPATDPAHEAVRARAELPDGIPPLADVSLLHEMSLSEMLDRFERGLSRSIALMDAREAENHLSERFVFVQPDPAVRDALRLLRPVEPVPSFRADGPGGIEHVPDNPVDDELQRSLGTLRKLTEQSRR